MAGVFQRGRLRGLLARVRAALRESFTDDQTPERIAGSFAIGVFLTMLPTLGVALIPMVYLAYRVEWINKVALFASGIVINPPVKWGVYAASVPIGVLLLGPIEGGTVTAISLDAGSDLLIRLVVGNLVLTVVATVISYVGMRRMVLAYRERELDVVEAVIEVVVEEIREIEESEEIEEINEIEESEEIEEINEIEESEEIEEINEIEESDEEIDGDNAKTTDQPNAARTD